MLFTGEYLHTIDDKQRLAVPSEIRSRLKPEIHGEAFYLVPGANGSLWLWPERTFERISAALESRLRANAGKRSITSSCPARRDSARPHLHT